VGLAVPDRFQSPSFSKYGVFCTGGYDLRQNKLHKAIANQAPMSTDMTSACALTLSPASCFIGEMASVICQARHLPPSSLFEQRRAEDVAWAEEFRPICQVSTSMTHFFLFSCLQNRSATACDSHTPGKSVAPSLSLVSCDLLLLYSLTALW
jgi:hypothetical protein